MAHPNLAQACADVQALSFDCYGTIIDWDAGIRAALGSIEALEGCDPERLLEERERLEHALLAASYRPYGEVLGESMRQAAAEQGRELSPAAQREFVASMGRWPAFDDSAAALERLAGRFRLALLSNVETATLKQSIVGLNAPFAELVTAEGVRSYKPAMAHFERALQRLQLSSDQVLHVAGSLYHDIRPALGAGWRAVWINRRAEAIPRDLDPAWVFSDLESLAGALGLGACDSNGS